MVEAKAELAETLFPLGTQEAHHNLGLQPQSLLLSDKLWYQWVNVIPQCLITFSNSPFSKHLASGEVEESDIPESDLWETKDKKPVADVQYFEAYRCTFLEASSSQW